MQSSTVTTAAIIGLVLLSGCAQVGLQGNSTGNNTSATVNVSEDSVTLTLEGAPENFTLESIGNACVADENVSELVESNKTGPLDSYLSPENLSVSGSAVILLEVDGKKYAFGVRDKEGITGSTLNVEIGNSRKEVDLSKC